MLITSETLPSWILPLAILIWTFRRRSWRSVVDTIPGPKSPSWIYGTPRILRLLPGLYFITTHTGHIPQFLLEYGKHEFQWQDTYGPVYAIKGCFGASPCLAHFSREMISEQGTRLTISDPRTAKYVLNSPLFTLGASHKKVVNLLFGYGNLAALAHGMVTTNSLILHPNAPQVTDTDSFAVYSTPASLRRVSADASP
jgi:hypothetical protein